MTRHLILFLILCWGVGYAFIPPHPDLLQDDAYRAQQTEWRRRLTLEQDTYSDLELIHPDVCQHVTAQECVQADRFMRQQAQSIRNLVEVTGGLRSLVLLMQFPNHRNRTLPSREDLRQVLTGRGTDPVLYPTGSVVEYVNTNSFHQLQMQFDMPLNWAFANKDEAHYARNKSGLVPGFMFSFNALLNELDGTVNWDDYDQDGDGFIDSLIVLHSGYGAERSGTNDCGDEPDSKNRIWSHAIGWIRENTWKSADGRVRVGTYMTTSALHGRCTGQVMRIGTATHELMHTWGLPDLYDTTWMGKGTGAYDLMSNPYGIDGTSWNPSFLGAWSRMELGWVEPKVLTHNGRYSLTTVQTTGQVYRIDQGFPEGEYLLIENRQPILWDNLLWNGGMLIWHIDEKGRRQKLRGYPGQEGWPGNGEHYSVAVVQADREYHLETGENVGFSDDFFSAGRELRPGPGVDIAVDASQYPNTDSYQIGIIKITGIRIFDISESQDTMTFQVTGLAPAVPTTPPVLATPFPTPEPKPTDSPTPKPTTVTTPTAPPTPKPTTRPTATPMPSLRPTTTFAPTITPMPTQEPTETMQPTAVPPSGGEANVGLAVGLTLLFTLLAGAVGFWIWRTYYCKNAGYSKKLNLVRRTRVIESGGEDPLPDDESGAVELGIGVACNESDCPSDEDSTTDKYAVMPIHKQASIASTETGNSSDSSNENAPVEGPPNELPDNEVHLASLSPIKEPVTEEENTSLVGFLSSEPVAEEEITSLFGFLASVFFDETSEAIENDSRDADDSPAQEVASPATSVEDKQNNKKKPQSPLDTLSYMDLALLRQTSTKSTDTGGSSESDEPTLGSALELLRSPRAVLERQDSNDSAATSPSAFH